MKQIECLHGFCQTGAVGGVLCFHNGSAPQQRNVTTGGVELLLNLETSVAGFAAVEVQVDGVAVEGMELESSDITKGNAIAAVCSWGAGALGTLSALAGKEVQIRVAITDARVYSLKLACAANTTGP